MLVVRPAAPALAPALDREFAAAHTDRGAPVGCGGGASRDGVEEQVPL